MTDEPVLRIAAVSTPMAAARSVEIRGLTQEDAIKFAETWIVNFMRTTAGDVTITWSET